MGIVDKTLIALEMKLVSYLGIHRARCMETQQYTYSYDLEDLKSLGTETMEPCPSSNGREPMPK